MQNNRQKGAVGEGLAVKYLEEEKYIIISQNFRFKTVGEIDIIALKNCELHFIEVKSRSSQRFGLAAEAVGHKKQNKIRLVASAFMAKNRFASKVVHFDVIEVNLISGQINLIEDAF